MKDLQNHSVAILGSGESGMGALRLACKHGLDSFLSDGGKISEDKKNEIEQLRGQFEENGHTVATLLKYDLIVKSPGISDTVEIIKSLKSSGKRIISEIEFASYFTDAKIIGITGSNGKTTTTLLTTHLLKKAGLNVASAGNVGNSFSDLLVQSNPEVIVLELSSFQLEGIVEFKPDIGILLNITPDHLDRYEYDINIYAEAKFRVFKNMDESGCLIVNKEDQLTQKKLQDNKIPASILDLSTRSIASSRAYLREGSLIFDGNNSIDIIPVENLPLIGVHNYYNQMAAVLAASQMGVSLNKVLTGLASFKNAPHRLEVISDVLGVEFINDSKATNVDAVYYALDAMTKPVIWVAGGINKGNDYAQIEELVKNKVKSMVCLGVDNIHLIEAFSDSVEETKEVNSAKSAVEVAFEMASKGDVVLLSPACSSFDLFDSYEQRGDMFKEEVLKLKGRKEGAKA